MGRTVAMLLVDDDPDVCELVRHGLASRQIEVVHGLTPEAADRLAAAQSLGIDRKTLSRKLVRYGVERES
jgi:DNA-binding NtrC family response regulator